MKKKGLSEVISTTLLILLTFALILIAWLLIYSKISENGETVQAKSRLISEKFNIKKASIQNETLKITIDSSTVEQILVNQTIINKSADIVFAIDSTGSMAQEIQDTKSMISSFGSKLKAENIDYRLALVEFKDFPASPCGNALDFPNKTHLFNSMIFTEDIETYKNEINNITVGGGTDIPESHLSALDSISGFNFRNNTEKIVIMLTDAPPHAQDCTVPKRKSLDVMLINDASTSMTQSGWTLNTTIQPILTFSNIPVPRNDYSPAVLFTKSSNKERLAVTVEWNGDSNYLGSESSEFGLNVKNTTAWYFENGISRPNVLASIVDPPNNVGPQNVYFSGISTKPQVVYIENPEMGNWQAKVWGWNLRPSNNPPPSLNVTIKIYEGDQNEIIKNPTILSSNASKKAAISFVDLKSKEDAIGLVSFSTIIRSFHNLTTSSVDIKDAIDKTTFSGGTNITLGILNGTNHLITKGSINKEKIIILLTDGQNDDGPEPVIAAANFAKSQGITIFTIGLTNFVNEDVLKNISTKPEYYYFSPDGSGLEEIYDKILQTINTEVASEFKSTMELCYHGPQTMQETMNKFKDKKIHLYYINKPEGLCINDLMSHNFTKETGGKFYSYSEQPGVSEIIVDLANTITNNYASASATNYLLIVFYNKTETYSTKVYDLPKKPYETKAYTIPSSGTLPITNIEKIEVYPVIVTSSGKEIVADIPSDTYII